MDDTEKSLLALAIRDAVGRLVTMGGDVSPTVVGSIAAGIAAGLNVETPTLGSGGRGQPAVRGVRFVTAGSPILEEFPPAFSHPPFFGGPEPGGPQPVSPGPNPGGPQPISPGPHPGGPQPISPGPHPGGPQPISPGPHPGGPQPISPGPHPGGPQPISPGPHPGGPQPISPGPHPGGPQPISPGPHPGGPQPISPGPHPGGPQPISPGPEPRGPQPLGGRPGVFNPFDPLINPAFNDAARHFGVVVFEGAFRVEVADHLAGIVRNELRRFVPLVRESRSFEAGAGPEGLAMHALPNVPPYVESIFQPFLRDLVEFAADRFGLSPPRRYRSDIQVTVTPPGGGSVAWTDADERDGEDRRLSWLYFVPWRDAYRGGDFVLYEAAEPAQLLNRLTRRIAVPPTPNSLILFPSALVHEITPVIAPASAQMTRPTVRGWLRWTD